MSVSFAQEFPGKSTRNRRGMGHQNGYLSQDALWFVEDTQLSQDRPSVVVDFLSCQTIFDIECVDATKCELDSPPGRKKTTPSAEVRAANHDFNQNGVVRNMPALHFDFHVRQSFHELLIELANSVRPFIMIAPCLVVVARSISESAENAFQIVLVLKSNVLLNQSNPSRRSLFRKRCACHSSPSAPDTTTGLRHPLLKWLSKLTTGRQLLLLDSLFSGVPMKRIACLLLFSCLFTLSAVADDDKDHPHHEDLTTAQLGTVHSPISCAASVQKPFERGVALLHSFWYEEAEKEFLQIAKDDPKCAMAHWGIAMSIWHQLWNEPDQKVIARGLDEVKAAVALGGQSTPREKSYIAAIGAFYSNSAKRDHDARAKAYSDAMKKVYVSYPDDHEAAVFYALSLLASEPHHDETFANRKEAAAILEKLFATEPDHPGVAHYLIHSYDKPQLAQLGIPAARRYAEVAPAAPHALHMPSHIFARVGLWQDDINSNLASIAATRKTAAMHMGGEGHQFHAMDFLVYAYLQSGREADAAKVIEEIKTMPKMESMYGMDFDPQTNALSAFPALYDLEMRHWSDAAALQPVPGALPGDLDVTYWARAIGAARNGDLTEAHKDLREIENLRQKALTDKKTDFAEGMQQDYQEAEAWILHAEGEDEKAASILHTIADRNDKLGDEPESIPAREMLADLLLESKHPQEALAEYKTDLKLNPNRFNGLYGAARAAEEAGKQSEANEYYALLLKTCDGGSSTRPELSHARELVAKK